LNVQQKLLVVDDAIDHQQVITYIFSSQYALTQAYSLAEADKALSRDNFDLILLDVNLPDGDGFSYFVKLQTQEHTRGIPVMFVTASGDAPQEVMGFSLGAEDYIIKPIEPPRLRARVESRLKRIVQSRERDTVLHKGDLKVSLSLQRVAVVRDGTENPIDLTPVEFKLLFHLLRYEDHVFTREQLLSAVWGNAAEVFDRTVDMHVSNLRKKILASDYKILAVHGTGYRFTKTKT
jgi:DNA-binding response OmpR family regulator